MADYLCEGCEHCYGIRGDCCRCSATSSAIIMPEIEEGQSAREICEYFDEKEETDE